MGAYIHGPIQQNSPYRYIAMRSIYETRWNEHPHFPIHLITETPRKLCFLDPLWYVYLYEDSDLYDGHQVGFYVGVYA